MSRTVAQRFRSAGNASAAVGQIRVLELPGRFACRPRTSPFEDASAMGFLKKFFKNTYRDGDARHGRSSFDNLSEDDLEAHLKIARYGSFQLTDAVRPSYDLQVVPRSGYRHDHYQDRDSGIKIPVLMACASREKVLDLFFDLLDPLGNTVDVVLETSHE